MRWVALAVALFAAAPATAAGHEVVAFFGRATGGKEVDIGRAKEYWLYWKRRST